MSDVTSIEWTDSTFNGWTGCTEVSPGCDNCYARAWSKRAGSSRVGQWGAGAPRVRTSDANWAQPRKWNATPFFACDCGHRGTMKQLATNAVHVCGVRFKPVRRRVFCQSLSDWLDNEVPVLWLVDLLDVIRMTPNLDWLLLTKRVGNWRKRIELALDACGAQIGVAVGAVLERAKALAEWLRGWLSGKAPENVWFGASIVNQREADRDVGRLLEVPAKVRFLSIEPMLGAIALAALQRIDWVIVGGESGALARPMHPDWVRSLRDGCAAAGTAFLLKQWGEWRPVRIHRDPTFAGGAYIESVDGSRAALVSVRTSGAGVRRTTGPMKRGQTTRRFHVFDDYWAAERVPKKAAGRLLDGVIHNAFPGVSSLQTPEAA